MRNYKTRHQLFTTLVCTHLCGALPHFNHLEQGHVLHPVLLMMAVHPAKAGDPPCSPTFGLVSKRLLPSPGCLLGRKMLKWKMKRVIALMQTVVLLHISHCFYWTGNGACWDWLRPLLVKQVWKLNKWRYKVGKTYQAFSGLCIFAIGILKVSIWRQLRLCLSVWTTHEQHVNKRTKQQQHFKTCLIREHIYVMHCLLRELKLCVQVLRCYHFFNIFWICWSRWLLTALDSPKQEGIFSAAPGKHDEHLISWF